MARLLLLLVLIFFGLNVLIWSLLFNGTTPDKLLLNLSPRPGPTASPEAPGPARIIAPPTPAFSPTPNPYANLRVEPRPTLAGTPIPPMAPSLQQPVLPPRAASLPTAATGTGQPFTSVIRDGDLNTQINQYLARQGDPPLKDVRVRFEPQQAVLTGRAEVAGLSVDVRASGPIVARNGRPAFLVQALDVGSVSTPDFVRGYVVDAVNETTRRLTSDLGVDVTEVRLGPGQLTVTGRTR